MTIEQYVVSLVGTAIDDLVEGVGSRTGLEASRPSALRTTECS